MQIQNKWNRAMIDLVFPRRCPICDEVMPYGAKESAENMSCCHM